MSGVVEVAGELERALESLAVPHMTIGGLAVLSHGVGRTTVDVDVAVSGETLTPDALLDALAPFGFGPRIDEAASFARRSNMLLLEHVATRVPVDLAFAWLPFELEAIASATRRRIDTTTVRVPVPTDLVVMKLVAHRPKDVDDAEHLVRLHVVDFARIRRVVAEFCEVLEDSTRLATVDRLERTARR